MTGNLFDVLFRRRQQFLLLGRNHCVADSHSNSAAGRILKALGLNFIQYLSSFCRSVDFYTLFNDLSQLFFTNQEGYFQIKEVFRIGAIHITQVLRNGLVEDQPSHRSIDEFGHLLAAQLFGHPHPDGGMESNHAFLIGHQRLVHIPEYLAFSRLAILHQGQVVGTEHHVLGRHGNGTSIGGLEQVVGGQHEEAGLCLCLCGQGNVNSHLVAVKVGVVGGTHQRMELQSAALDQHRLKCLDSQSVQGRRTVEKHWMIFDNGFQRVPNRAFGPLYHLPGALDVTSGASFHQTFHDKGLEELQRHLFGQTTLIHLQLRADDDNRTSGIVNTFAQQVLAETSLFTLEHIAEGFQRPVVGAGHRTSPAAVVDQRVHRFLKHPLLVADDDIRSAQLQKPF